MSKEKTFRQRVLEVFTNEAETPVVRTEVFGEAMTVNGVSLVWDGEELIEGVELRVMTEEGEVLAPDGEHAIEIGEVITVVVTEGGIIMSIADQEESDEEEMGASEDVIIEFSKVVNEKFAKEKEVNTKAIEALTNSFNELSEKFDALVDATDESKKKFNKVATGKKETVATWKKYSK